jgi:GNAT superfamily N-acetyltransferase
MGLGGETVEYPLPGLNWRAMTSTDLDEVVRVAAIGFPDHFEDRACFENRLALNPSGCSVLAGEGGVFGYLIAYPWRDGEIPPLNTRIKALPTDADRLYLHDLALDPAVRGGGHAAVAIESLAARARSDGWPAISLVAVNEAAPFWERHGFKVVESPALAAKLASYGPEARYMVRAL